MGVSYSGRVLRVNLSTGQLTQERLPEEWHRLYLGGWSLVAYTLLHEVAGDVDALEPRNRFIFAPGVMTGVRMGGSGRNAVGAKSPLTGGFGEADVGGFWGAELKRAGWDGIIVEGASSTPVYLWIDDDSAELRDARHLWGKPTAEVQQLIQDELGDERVRVCQIGPAGEQQARHACVLNDLNHAAGRCGLGAVLGAKMLRAVATRGSRDVDVVSPEPIRNIATWTRERLETDPRVSTLHSLGQAGDMGPMNETGGLPTRNFRQGQFDGIDRITGERMAETLRIRNGTCFACGIACKSVVEAHEPYEIDPMYGGPEYESIAALGSCCGVDSLETICKANELCNAYGIDTIGVGATIAWAMEAYERGLLPRSRTDGIDLRFGNEDALIELVRRIASREGIGDWLAEGAYRCAQSLGQGSEDFVVHSHGQEAPMHDPRLKHALGVGYAISPTGADHMHNIHDSLFESKQGIADLARVGIFEPLPADDLSPAKMRMARHTICWNVLWNCVGLCQTFRFDRNHMCELVNAATGWDVTVFELQEVGERALTMAREFNHRCGFTAADDRLASRFFSPLENGPLKGEAVPKEAFREAMSMFYDMMGWESESGAPHDWKLHSLGLGWVSDQRKSV